MSKAPFASSVIQDDRGLQHWCQQRGLPFQLVTLDKLEDVEHKHAYVHTGAEKNEYNNGYNNHWLYLYGSWLFDSYGYQRNYKLPSWVQNVQLVPSRIQEFGSNVCGEYASVFYMYAHTLDEKQNRTDLSGIGKEFCEEFNFTKNRNANDNIVLQVFKNGGLTPSNVNSSLPSEHESGEGIRGWADSVYDRGSPGSAASKIVNMGKQALDTIIDM